MNAFESAFMQMIPNEVGHDLEGGGYTNDPDDPGGETRWGIAKRFHPHVDIQNMTIDVAKSIYKKDYWDRMNLNPLANIAPRLATKVFDAGVNIGQNSSVKMLQKVLNTCEPDTHAWIMVDGVIGPKTLEKVVKVGEDQAIQEFCKEQLEYYVNLNKPKFINGWTKRALWIPEG